MFIVDEPLKSAGCAVFALFLATNPQAIPVNEIMSPDGYVAYSAIPSPEVGSLAIAGDLRSAPDMLFLLNDQASLSWTQLAGMLGVSRRSIHYWLNDGKVSQTNLDAIRQLYDKYLAGERIEDLYFSDESDFTPLRARL